MSAQVAGGDVIWLGYPKLHPRAKIELSSSPISVNRRYATGSCPVLRALIDDWKVGHRELLGVYIASRWRPSYASHSPLKPFLSF